jgi:hypothetical protein
VIDTKARRTTATTVTTPHRDRGRRRAHRPPCPPVQYTCAVRARVKHSTRIREPTPRPDPNSRQRIIPPPPPRNHPQPPPRNTAPNTRSHPRPTPANETKSTVADSQSRRSAAAAPTLLPLEEQRGCASATPSKRATWARRLLPVTEEERTTTPALPGRANACRTTVRATALDELQQCAATRRPLLRARSGSRRCRPGTARRRGRDCQFRACRRARRTGRTSVFCEAARAQRAAGAIAVVDETTESHARGHPCGDLVTDQLIGQFVGREVATAGIRGQEIVCLRTQPNAVLVDSHGAKSRLP